MIDWLTEFVNTHLVRFVGSVLLALLVLFVGLKLVKFFTSRMERCKLILKVDSNIFALIVNTLRVLLNSFVIIAAIQILGVPSATILAVIGSCGLAVGLALQGGLSNLAGGVMIMIFKPFHSGDYICTTQGDGFVEEIGIFYTRLVTIDSRSVNIPNSILASTTVTNLFAKATRGVDIEISVAYGADIGLAQQVLLECTQNRPLILADPAPKVFVSAHADSAIKLTLRVFAKSQHYWQVHAELMEASLKAFSEAGLEIPFPQVDVHMKG